MEKILISACLLGEPVRYNGHDKRSDDEILLRWIREGRVISVCPELLGGLGVPRLPAEIERGAGGHKVLAGDARVIASNGKDVSGEFIAGAERALQAGAPGRVRVAVLKEGSPSCGTSYVYDGTFTSTRVTGSKGVTAALLEQNGIRVFSELELADADAFLRTFEK